MNYDNVLSLLGIAQRGRRLVSGQDVVKREITRGRVALMIIAEDTSFNSKDKFVSLSKKHGIPVLIWGNSYDLGRALGQNKRTAIGITDKNFAVEISKRLKF